MVPYFEQSKQTINEDIYDELVYLNKVPFVRGQDLDHLDILPDGAIKFYEANEHNLTYRI